jgi:TolB protein
VSETTTVTADAARTRDWARWRPWLVAGLALWLVIGVDLVDRANRQGQVSDIEFSPAHLLAYSGLLVLAAYVLWAFFRALRRGHWREAFPAGYAGLGVGFLAALGWLVLDSVWRSTLGISGLENVLAPPRFLIPIAVAAVAWGPVAEAIRARHRRTTSLRHAVPAVVGAAIVASALTLVGYNPVREPRNDWTFGTQRDQAEIWTMAKDGSSQTRVLAALETGIDFSLPTWSPDASRIAYTRWANEPGVALNVVSGDQTASIWTMAADGSDAHVVVDGTHGQAWIPAWSPDGAWITYTLSPVGQSGSPAQPQPQANLGPGQLGPPAAASGGQIWVVHPDGTGARALTSGGDSGAAAWSPDGKQIAFNSSAAGQSDIRVATVTDAGLSDDHSLATDPANDWSPAWSPDGTRIAFSSNRSGGDDIWVVGVDGTGLMKLTDDRGADWVPAWTPDGTRIVFVSDRGDDVEVWSMAADGSDLRDLSNSPGSDDGRWSVSIASDGRLAFGRAAYPVGPANGFTRFDLAAAMTLLWAIGLAVLALLLAGLGAPLGGFTLALVLLVAIGAVPTDQWQFLPAAVVAGVTTDLAVRFGPGRQRDRIAGAALPAFGVLALEATLASAGTEAWSVTLSLGVATAAALLGLGLAEVVRRLAPAPA